MSIATSIRKLFFPPAEQPFDSQSYWEDRHDTDRGSLKAVGHRALSEAQNQTQYADKAKRITALIQRYVPERQGKTLLDAGCGVGALTQAYLDLGFWTMGVDFSTTAIAQARQSVPSAQFVVSALSSLHLGQQFDVICVTDVLLHVVDKNEWRSTLEALIRHLKPAGLLVLLDCLNPGDTNWSKHVNPRPLAQYESVLSQLGWRIVEHDRVVFEHENGTKDMVAIQRSH